MAIVILELPTVQKLSTCYFRSISHFGQKSDSPVKVLWANDLLPRVPDWAPPSPRLAALTLSKRWTIKRLTLELHK